MTKNLDKDGFSSIVDNYQLFYIDIWGVIHNGVTLHQEAVKTLKEISKKGKEYVLLTNAPRPNQNVNSFLKKRMGSLYFLKHDFLYVCFYKKELISSTLSMKFPL